MSESAPEVEPEVEETVEPEVEETEEDAPSPDDAGRQLTKAQRALKRANAEAKRWREIAQGKRKDDGDDEIEKEKGPDFRRSALISSGVGALLAAGYTGNAHRAQKLVAMGDHRGIEPDQDGVFDPDSYDSLIEDIRDEWPELFRSENDEKPTARRPGVNSRSAGTGAGTGGRKLTADEEFAVKVMGSAGYGNVADRIRRGAR
jgi:hypothetical protein